MVFGTIHILRNQGTIEEHVIAQGRSRLTDHRYMIHSQRDRM